MEAMTATAVMFTVGRERLATFLVLCIDVLWIKGLECAKEKALNCVGQRFPELCI